MDSDDKLEELIDDYRIACLPVSKGMREDMIAIPSTILAMAAAYSQHGDVNIYFMEVHAAIFALAYDNPEDFADLANWWKAHNSRFNELIETLEETDEA